MVFLLWLRPLLRVVDSTEFRLIQRKGVLDREWSSSFRETGMKQFYYTFGDPDDRKPPKVLKRYFEVIRVHYLKSENN